MVVNNSTSDDIWDKDQAQETLESDKYLGFVVYPDETGLIIQVRNPQNQIFFVDMLFTILHNLADDKVYAGFREALEIEDANEDDSGAWELVMPWNTLSAVSNAMLLDETANIPPSNLTPN